MILPSRLTWPLGAAAGSRPAGAPQTGEKTAAGPKLFLIEVLQIAIKERALKRRELLGAAWRILKLLRNVAFLSAKRYGV